MEREFKVGDRVVIKFDGHSSPGTIIQLNSYDESFVETTTGTTWYDNSRLTLRGKQKRNTITKKDILTLMEDVECLVIKGKGTMPVNLENVYNQWKTNLTFNEEI
jgi:hypothetical protein